MTDSFLKQKAGRQVIRLKLNAPAASLSTEPPQLGRPMADLAPPNGPALDLRVGSEKNVVYAAAPQPEVTATKRKKGNDTRGEETLDTSVAALIVTKPFGIREAEYNEYRTYALNTKLLRNWLGEDPISRFTSSINLSSHKPPLTQLSKQISGVHGFSFNNFYGKMIAEREQLGSTVMTWSDYQSGTEFSAMCSTWE
jgi:hypothetical protein